MSKHQIFNRYELKYHLPSDEATIIREMLRPYLRTDPNGAHRPGGVYTVRSIYFDSEDLRFYYEKRDGLKIRKKLRIRTYNGSSQESLVFLEIKRKFGRCIHKERVGVPLVDLVDALDGKPPEAVLNGRPLTDRQALERFRFNLRTAELRPVVLVSYEREAYVGVENPAFRVTFDRDIRSLVNPELDQIFDERELRQFEDRQFVLELKFDQRMPKWMARLVTRLSLAARPYSKYCRGIDAWDARARRSRRIEDLRWGAPVAV